LLVREIVRRVLIAGRPECRSRWEAGRFGGTMRWPCCTDASRTAPGGLLEGSWHRGGAPSWKYPRDTCSRLSGRCGPLESSSSARVAGRESRPYGRSEAPVQIVADRSLGMIWVGCQSGSRRANAKRWDRRSRRSMRCALAREITRFRSVRSRSGLDHRQIVLHGSKPWSWPSIRQ
jgi:hypothetical protein